MVRSGGRKAEPVDLGRAKGGTRRGKPRNGDGRTEPNDPKDGVGNTKGDQAWLADMTDAGKIELIGDDEQDIPFGALKRWTGNPEDQTQVSYWKLPPEGSRCAGKAKIRDERGRPIIDSNNEILMRPCTKWPILGSTVCVHHGGGVKTVKQAAHMRLLAAADHLIGQLIAIAADNKIDAKARVMAINSALDRAGVKGTIEITVDVPKYKEMLAGMFGEWGGSSDGDGD